MPDGRPTRIDKAFSWEAPIAAHGMLHTVIRNAWAGDPYPIDTLFLYMANMAWNSAMNTSETAAMLADRDPATGEYRIPRFIYSDAFASETVAYADLVLPDTTYLERWDCISMLDRPIGSAEGPADSIRQPVVAPDRDVRPFQDVPARDRGASRAAEASSARTGRRAIPGGIRTFSPTTSTARGSGRSRGGAAPPATRTARESRIPASSPATSRTAASGGDELAPSQRYFKHFNRDYLAYAKRMGFIGSEDPVFLQLYCEPLQRFRLSARGHGEVRPPEEHRAGSSVTSTPFPSGTRPSVPGKTRGRTAAKNRRPARGRPGSGAWPLHAVTQRPMAMYHSWGSQNAWLRSFTRATVSTWRRRRRRPSG